MYTSFLENELQLGYLVTFTFTKNWNTDWQLESKSRFQGDLK